MVRFLARFLGLLIFAAGFIALIADGVRSIAASKLSVMPLRETWTSLHPQSLVQVEGFVQQGMPPYVWGMVVQPVLQWPTFAIVGLIGILLLLAGTARPRGAPIRSI